MTDNSTYTEWRMENLLFCCFAFELCSVIYFLGQMLRFFSISRFSEGSVHSTSIVTNLKKISLFSPNSNTIEFKRCMSVLKRIDK